MRVGGRFIPACAGNARTAGRFWSGSPVHPRVRGERELAAFFLPPSAGSSPRARGTPSPHKQAPKSTRFIPACAGNANADDRHSATGSVHPRVRGERRLSCHAITSSAGSSPRARGNAGQMKEIVWGRAVHPRVRGERFLLRSGARRKTGSSPRARGTRRSPLEFRQRYRFIPACAGNACAGSGRRPPRAVHPRVRGERQYPNVLISYFFGSSPRARGTRYLSYGRARHRRFIPACAGNAMKNQRSTTDTSVHPRVRGERSFTNL